MGCLDPETVLGMLDGSVGAVQAATIEAHLDDCPSCRRLLSEAAAEDEPAPGELTGALGPYQLIERIGRGGMGDVYRARDPRLGRDVAIKVLRSRRRQEREARAAAAINHPNVVAVFDVGEDRGAPYVVTELLVGHDLRWWAKRGVAWRQAVDWAHDIALGLAAAHDRGVVHCDLKPENVFVATGGQIKILDFGLAQLAEHTDPDGVIAGSLGYMAPEQLDGTAVDHRADLFALGCVLFELLSGRRAFSGTTEHQVIEATVSGAIPELTDTVVPRGFAQVIRRCLAKDPAHRFQSARDLAFAFDLLGGDVPRTAPVRKRRAWRCRARSPRWAHEQARD